MWNDAWIAVLVTSMVAAVWGQDATVLTPADQCICGDLETRVGVLENTVLQLIRRDPDREFHCNSNAYDYVEIRLCDAMKIEREYATLHATRPVKQTSPEICRVLFRARDYLDQYVYSVDLYNQAGWQGPNSGHPGVIFNVIDSDNFDFVYFRPHWASRDGCLQHGYVMAGIFYPTTETRCPGAAIEGSTWFTVKVESSQGRASVYVNDVNLSEVNAHFPTRSQMGIYVANGYSNVIRFRNVAVTILTN